MGGGEEQAPPPPRRSPSVQPVLAQHGGLQLWRAGAAKRSSGVSQTFESQVGFQGFAFQSLCHGKTERFPPAPVFSSHQATACSWAGAGEQRDRGC